jgi:hypothetical protein
MDKIIFYLFIAIIIPTCFSLFTFGNMVYTIGEFKEHTLKVPETLINQLFKLIFIGVLNLHMFHYFIHNYIPENFYFISLSINIYIMIEYIAINTTLNSYRKYLINNSNQELDVENFNKFILINTKNLLKNNLAFFVITQLICLIIGVLLIFYTIHFYSIFNVLMLIIYTLVIGMKFYITKYVSTL